MKANIFFYDKILIRGKKILFFINLTAHSVGKYSKFRELSCKLLVDWRIIYDGQKTKDILNSFRKLPFQYAFYFWWMKAMKEIAYEKKHCKQYYVAVGLGKGWNPIKCKASIFLKL